MADNCDMLQSKDFDNIYQLKCVIMIRKFKNNFDDIPVLKLENITIIDLRLMHGNWTNTVNTQCSTHHVSRTTKEESN